MKVCKSCNEEVLQSSRSWDTHQKSYARLKASKEAKCLFCTQLWNDVVQYAPELAHDDEIGRKQWPVHRWSVRSLAKFRENIEGVKITFRAIPRLNSDDKAVEEIVGGTAEKGDNRSAWITQPLPCRNFYLFPEDELAPVPTARSLSKTTNPAISAGRQIQQWLHTCDISHSDCHKRQKSNPNVEPFVPTRLLDISGPAHKPIKVVETKPAGIKGPYMSLSHCWGDPNKGAPKIYVLSRSNETELKSNGIQWHLLAKNFQDAIEIARFLKVNYIWIDSLCIVQGNDGDFHSEASLMHQVYRNSYCNIAIVDSKDSAGGAFRDRNTEDVALVRYQAKSTSSKLEEEANEPSPMLGSKAWRIVPENLWGTELLQTFLYRRGWVFQERMLAPRILHFAHRQIFWDCPSLSACESLPAGLPLPLDQEAGPDRHWRGRLQEPGELGETVVAGVNDDSPESFWKVAVSKYTSCALTKGEDKLTAIWGIAKLVRDVLQVEYGAGLWEKDLPDQLAWRVAECTFTQRPSESTEKNLARKVPSWSWASMDGEIVVQDRLTDAPHYFVKDHNQQPLTFDLKGIKRFASPELIQGSWNSPQPRGMSDTVLELQRRYKELKRKESTESTITNTSEHRSSSPEKYQRDRDAQPEFSNPSLPIQGHVGRATLVETQKGSNKWRLKPDEIGDTVIEAYPDTVIDESKSVGNRPYFVVLSAKKVVLDSTTGWAVDENDKFVPMTSPPIGYKVEGWETDQKNMEIHHVYSGVGILLKKVPSKPGHYARTGAFRFRNVSEDVWVRLQRTLEMGKVLQDRYDSQKGLKFWLD